MISIEGTKYRYDYDNYGLTVYNNHNKTVCQTFFDNIKLLHFNYNEKKNIGHIVFIPPGVKKPIIDKFKAAKAEAFISFYDFLSSKCQIENLTYKQACVYGSPAKD